MARWRGHEVGRSLTGGFASGGRGVTTAPAGLCTEQLCQKSAYGDREPSPPPSRAVSIELAEDILVVRAGSAEELVVERVHNDGDFVAQVDGCLIEELLDLIAPGHFVAIVIDTPNLAIPLLHTPHETLPPPNGSGECPGGMGPSRPAHHPLPKPLEELLLVQGQVGNPDSVHDAVNLLVLVS